MNSRYLRRAQAVLGVAILLVGIAVSPASAAEEPKEESPGTAPEERPPGGFNSWEELTEAQDKLNGAADHILSAESPGYAGTVAAPENGALYVYWSGPVPADAQERARETGVPVKFLQARFSAEELAHEVLRLGADERVFTAMPDVDGSGIAVSVGNDADRDAILAEALLPLSVTVERPPSLLYDRQNDITPYWGGARWDNRSTGSYCSTGFGVNFFGQQKMLTAGHCGANGNIARIGNATQPNTTLSLDVNPRDTLMIDRPVGRSFAGRIYSGGIYSSSSYRVVGGAPDYVGNWVCTGGARTGQHCNAQVRAVNVSVLGISPLTFAVAGVNTCVAAPGDSGGPVFAPRRFFGIPLPFPQFGAVARGTITAGYLDTPCLADSGSRMPPPIIITGSYRVFYAPVLRPFFDPNIGSLQFYGATLL
ncbi:MAG TPA: hypothetical protein VFC19_07030 [Candidatus Limnocylindrales bacterium]|nr:hypothetical protein [Candidatus Limnocylindrales bacterium]